MEPIDPVLNLPAHPTRAQLTAALRSWLDGVPEVLRRGLTCRVCNGHPEVLETHLKDDHDCVVSVDCHGRRFAVRIPAQRWDRGSNRPRRLVQEIVQAARQVVQEMNSWGTRPIPRQPVVADG